MDGKIADRKGYEYMRKLVSSTPKTGAGGGESKVSNATEKESTDRYPKRKSGSEAKVVEIMRLINLLLLF